MARVPFHTQLSFEPYQKLRYGSNVLFRYGPNECVEFAATPLPGNPARPSLKD